MTRVFLAGAAGQLGVAIAAAFADGELVAHTRATLDVTDADAVRRAVADAAPVGGRSTAPRSTTSMAPRIGRSRRLRSTRWRCAAWRAPRRTSARRSSTTAPTSCSMARADAPYREEDAAVAAERLRDVEAGGRVVRARHRARVRAARREPLRNAARLAGPARDARRHRRRPRAGPAGARSSPIASCRRATSSTSPPPRGTWSSPAPRRACITASTRDTRRGTTSPPKSARLLGVPPRLEPITMADVPLRAPRPRFCALANRKLADAGFPMPHWQDALARWIASRDRSAA